MKAYTLIETIIVLVVIGIVAAIGVPMMMQAADAWSFSSQLQNNAVLSFIVASSRMAREMRVLKDDVSITTANNTMFTFTDTSNNSISFARVGNTLMRNSDGLADNVSSLTFTYFDDDDNVIATPIIAPNNTNIRRISVALSVSAGSNTLNYFLQVRPQNLRRLNEKFK